MILPLAAKTSTICYEASIFLIATRPGPYFEIASATSLAPSDSPSAFRIAAFVSSSYFCTMNLLRSAICWAIYFYSIDYAKSFEN